MTVRAVQAVATAMVRLLSTRGKGIEMGDGRRDGQDALVLREGERVSS